MIIKLRKTERIQIKSSKDVFKVLKSILDRQQTHDQKKENFWAMGLTIANDIIYVDLVSLGSLGHTVVSPREVFILAIQNHAAHIIIAHNHPSGRENPSKADKRITKNLVKAGKLLEIEVTDHLIIGSNKYCSFKDEDMI